jgi:Divergent InlB B-repeat domain
MRYLWARYSTPFLWSLFFLAATISTPSWVSAAGIVLSWQDNSTNEDGFKIERAINANYVEIASVGPNIKTYTDSGLVGGTTYCYRILAFNSGGVSSPSNESCATIPIATFTLNLTKLGTGSGSVTSNPAGITCGSDCSEVYPSGTVVSLIAAPAAGSTFAGWSGDSDCSDGNVTMTANKTCTATFSLSPAGYGLTVNIASGLSSGGSGSGTVTSNPAGINCGSDCSETYTSGTVVSLTAIPVSGSTFAGWSGDSDCVDAVVTMTANKSCTATFNVNTLTLNVVKSGNGTINSNPSGINCGNECSKSYPTGTKVTLSAKPGQNSKFAGWAGGGCQGVADCTITLNTSTSVDATFVGSDPSAIGIFRPSTGEWFLDANGNGIWEGCNIDLCLGPNFGSNGDLPVAGNWTGTGLANIGFLRPATGDWFIDLNGNGRWDGCKIDRCLKPLRPQSSLPLVGDWTGAGADKVGEMVPGQTPKWYLDVNGDGVLQNCKIDLCLKFGGAAGDLPVAGDWTGTGTAKVGLFRASTGEWFLDLNGNGQSYNCTVDKCVKFGAAGDLPVVGDWTGAGIANIGVYRPATGEWFLDLNGNGQWDGCGIDACIQFRGKSEGDLPVVGIWRKGEAVN